MSFIIPKTSIDITLGTFESLASKGSKEAAIIKSVFEQCDTEGKTDKDGNVVGDGKLTGNERSKFLNMLRTLLPDNLMNTIDTLFSSIEQREKEAKAEQKDKIENPPFSGLS